jgi:hypothetical protein
MEGTWLDSRVLNVPVYHLHYRYIKGSACEQNISTEQYLYVHILGKWVGYRGEGGDGRDRAQGCMGGVGRGGVAMGSHQLLEKHEKPIGVFCMQTLHSLA